jgi:alkylhydroperoxidase family enzyme
MSILKAIDPNDASGPTKAVLDAFDRQLGRVPSMVRLMANSPATADAYLHFNKALENSAIPPKTRVLVAAAIAEWNACDYTLSIAMAMGRRQGIPEEDLEAARHGRSADARTADLLRFALSIVRLHGRVPQEDVEHLQRNGFSDAEIVDVVGLTALNVFRNYFNLITVPEIDLPLVKAGTTQPA